MPGADPLTAPAPPAAGPLAVGVDIVETARLRRLVGRWGDRVLERLFTGPERAALRGRRGLRYDSLAGHYAAKEATRKIFGSRGEMPRWTDIEVVSGSYGEPTITLSGDASAAAARCGFRTLQLSIAHERHAAVAVVVAM